MEQPRKIVPAGYALLALIAMALLDRYVPLAEVISPPYSYAGGAFPILGIAVALINGAAFRTLGTPVAPFHKSTMLVTTGFYRYTRNPMYIGLSTALLGAAILFGSLGAFLPIPYSSSSSRSGSSREKSASSRKSSATNTVSSRGA
jgi:protein-S-isoprenylcysteine O-methyltransferase Ste14